MGCDANAQHTVWDSTDINARGEDLFSFIAGSDLEVANVSNEPTFRNALRGEVLDLTHSQWRLARDIVTPSALECAVGCPQLYKSPGIDGIFPALLSQGMKELERPLLLLFRASIAFGHVLRRWKETRVVFIPKPGRPSYLTAKDFRPISLTSFLLKTLERLVHKYITDFLGAR